MKVIKHLSVHEVDTTHPEEMEDLEDLRAQQESGGSENNPDHRKNV
jgi:ribosomal protein L29